MTIQEIKTAIEENKRVFYKSMAYEVIIDSIGQYLISHKFSDHCIGLTNRAGDKLNGEPQDFFIK